MGLKVMFYIILLLTFFLFFQRSPVVAVVIIVMFIGGVIFFKSRKKRSRTGGFGLMKGRQNSQVDNMLTLMMLNDLFHNNTYNSQNRPEIVDKKTQAKKEYLNNTKREILALLDDD